MKRNATVAAICIAVAVLSGCDGSSPDPSRVFASKSDAEQYVLKNYCKADSARREFGVKEAITCDDGTTLKIVRVWNDKGGAAGFKIETAS